FQSVLLAGLAVALLMSGRLERAKRVAETVLASATVAGERTYEAYALFVCAEASGGGTTPAYRTALELYERARAIAADTELRPLLAHCELGRARVLRDFGDPAAGRGAARAALDSL